MSSQDFINAIQNKQLENSLKLAKQTVIKIGDKIYNKKPLSSRQWREIAALNQKMVDAQTELERTDLLIEMRAKGALYYFNIPADIFDENYEMLSPIIEGHILRSNMGATTSDIDFADLLKRFEHYNNTPEQNIENTSTNGKISTQQQHKTKATKITK